MSNRLLITACSLLFALSVGCSPEIRVDLTPSQTPSTITATLPPTRVPEASETPLPPAPQATAAPVDGVTSTQVNVRAEPSTTSNVVGMIPAEMMVQITGKDPAENWFQINYPQGVDGKGWVTAQYITTANAAAIPTIGGSEAGPDSGSMAVVQQQLNVRSGPGTGFNSLGTLNPQDVVSLIGKDPNGAWLQINFAAGPDGKGWVNAAFVQAQGVEVLPIIAESGQVIGTGTPTSIPFTPTPTLVPAREDQDTPVNPIASVVFKPAGTQTLIYNGDISAPQGDTEDWIAFTSQDPFVFASIACKGTDVLQIETLKNNTPLNVGLACGDPMKKIPVETGAKYVVHIQMTASQAGLQYTNYILTIKTRP